MQKKNCSKRRPLIQDNVSRESVTQPSVSALSEIYAELRARKIA